MSQTQQQPMIMITPGLAAAIMMYLKNGGDRLTGDLLAEQLQIQANAPQTAAEQKMAFDAAVSAEVAARTKNVSDNTGIVTHNQVGDNFSPPAPASKRGKSSSMR